MSHSLIIRAAANAAYSHLLRAAVTGYDDFEVWLSKEEVYIMLGNALLSNTLQ